MKKLSGKQKKELKMLAAAEPRKNEVVMGAQDCGGLRVETEAQAEAYATRKANRNFRLKIGNFKLADSPSKDCAGEVAQAVWTRKALSLSHA